MRNLHNISIRGNISLVPALFSGVYLNVSSSDPVEVRAWNGTYRIVGGQFWPSAMALSATTVDNGWIELSGFTGELEPTDPKVRP